MSIARYLSKLGAFLGSDGKVPAAALATGAAIPAGEVAFFATSTAPTGWLKANGALVSRTTYADLFAAIGTTFGAGDGSTTFALPDMRGYFPRGWDDARGIDTGRTLGSSQADDFKSHAHYISGFGNGSDLNGGPLADSGTRPASYLSTFTGGTETRPKNVALLSCIKY